MNLKCLLRCCVEFLYKR